MGTRVIRAIRLPSVRPDTGSIEPSWVETLRDGRRVEIRALRHEDRDGLEEAVSRASAESLRRRFFSVRRHLSEQEIEFFSNIDFVSHVALVVVAEEGGGPHIVGAGRYIVVEPA
jgi:hypothetical protein